MKANCESTRDHSRLNRRSFVAQGGGAILAGVSGGFSSFPFEAGQRAAIPARAPNIISCSLIFRHPACDPYDRENRHGFNHAPSVTMLSDGRLLAAWFSAPFEASVQQVILASSSLDGGVSWTPAEVLQDFPRLSDFDPAFIADGRRTWFFFSAGRWIRWPFLRDEKDQVGVNSYRTYSRYSDDSGRTWSAPQVAGSKMFCRSNGIRLSTGELLLPVYFDVGDSASVLKSSDGGATWSVRGRVTTPERKEADEPSIAELNSGGIMMVLRTGDGHLWRSISRDKGDTWLTPEKTGLAAVNSSHNLFRLQDGRLLLTHNPSPSHRTPLTMRVSDDDGRTWGEPLTLAEVPIPGPDEEVWNRQVSYPSVSQLRDGTVIVVWTQIFLSDAEQYGDIHSARIRV